VQVVPGDKTVEVRNAGVDKVMASRAWLLNIPCDFILAIGDDLTDEDLFAVLPWKAFSIRVGNRPTRALFHVRAPEEVLQLLESLIDGEYIEQPFQAYDGHSTIRALAR